MTSSEVPYDRWLEEALRGVIRRALAYFYLTFLTAAEGVELAPELGARYPDEMTIVLQHQFWDLTVEDDRFAVTLKFRGRPSRIVIPFAAISAFGDPSVNFGLQLKTSSSEAAADEAAADTAGEVIALDSFRKK